jgi:hypothetical protein
MFQLNDQEKSRLILNAGDKTLVEGLRKLFVNEFLSDDRPKMECLRAAFRALENLKETHENTPEIKNIL